MMGEWIELSEASSLIHLAVQVQCENHEWASTNLWGGVEELMEVQQCHLCWLFRRRDLRRRDEL